MQLSGEPSGTLATRQTSFRHHPDHRRAGHQPTQPCDSFGAPGPDTLVSTGPTNFLNRVCSGDENPSDNQLNEPEAQGIPSLPGIPPEATLRDRPTRRGRITSIQGAFGWAMPRTRTDGLHGVNMIQGLQPTTDNTKP